MTTHPPGHPGAPTGPGREAREQWLDANADRLPTLAEIVADAERLIDQALAVLDRRIDPATYPTGRLSHVADAEFEVAGFHLEATRRALHGITKAAAALGADCSSG
jgi:hypothetical protein